MSCNESRKKCDIERPCQRCVKLKHSCVERPPRATKKRKLDEDSIENPQRAKGNAPTTNQTAISHGLPSPVSETDPTTGACTPMRFDQGCSTIVSIDDRDMGSDSSRQATIDPTAPQTLELEFLPEESSEVPSPLGGYLEGISLDSSDAPIFGLEGSDAKETNLLQQLLMDLDAEPAMCSQTFGDMNAQLSVLPPMDGVETMPVNSDDFEMDLDAIIASIPLGDVSAFPCGDQGGEVQMIETEAWGFKDWDSFDFSSNFNPEESNPGTQ